MTQTAETPVSRLRDIVRGDVVGVTDEGYDDSRRVWSASIDRRPLLVVRCLDEADVRAAVRFATAEGLEITVRGGAHNMSGAAVVDDGMVIDLSRMNHRQRLPPQRQHPARLSIEARCPSTPSEFGAQDGGSAGHRAHLALGALAG